jgi:membrane protein DedA with SNARE-associated domain
MSRLDVHKTMLLSTVSSLLWNFILIYLGMMFGENIISVDKYLSTYSNIVVTVSILLVIILVIKYFLVKKKTN